MRRYPTFLLLSLLAFSVAGIAVFSAPAVTLSGATGSHDPSRMILCDGKYYVYSTGGGMKCSSDGINWTSGPSPFATAAIAEGTRPGRGVTPASVKAIVPEDRGIWAPDIIFYNHKYCLYYSVAAPLAISHRAIGLLTSPTLDPAAPDYQWTDAGVVISTWNKVEKKSAIDPCPFVDAKGDLWMSWGSGYANGSSGNDPTIIISKLDNATGLRSKTDANDYPVAPGHIEGSYVHYRAGYYYAFWNDGESGPPPNATYRIHVARSENVTGPYVNKAGKVGADDIFMATMKEQGIQGPGHMGIESEPGLDRFTFHYYNAAGRPVLGVRTLVWGADGWPSVGEDPALGAYKITADNGLALSVRGDDSADGAFLEVVSRPPGQKGFVAQAKRWVVERPFGWLNRCRRLSKDHEVKTEHGETMIRVASIKLRAATIRLKSCFLDALCNCWRQMATASPKPRRPVAGLLATALPLAPLLGQPDPRHRADGGVQAEAKLFAASLELCEIYA